MTVSCVGRGVLVALVFVLGAGGGPAWAQGVFEAAGERALGMGGAFVAVADDATAVQWNPAGLVGGQPAGMTIGWHHFQVGNPDAVAAAGASTGRSTLTSLGTWPLGVSYGTFRRTVLRDDPSGVLQSESLQVGHFGVTVLQGIVPGLVAGTTLKVLRGGLAAGPVDQARAGAALEAGGDLDVSRRTSFDLDVALMARGGRVAAGVILKNVRSPEFRAVAGNSAQLPRQARAGVSLLPADGVTLAMDLDLNTVDLMGDLRRVLAVGGETSLGSRLQVRSGVRWNLAGDRRIVGAVGASVSVRRGLWIDGHYALGRSDEARELGVALRAGFQ
jgi:hypothetical protein